MLKQGAILGVGLSLVLCSTAMAETVHLKSGTKVVGKILKEDDESFLVRTGEKNEIVILKHDVAVAPPRSPWIAFLGSLVLPGAGHLYAAESENIETYNRAALFLGLTLISGGASYMLGKSLDASYCSVAGTCSFSGYALAGGVGIPALLAGFDAASLVNANSDRKRYVIDF